MEHPIFSTGKLNVSAMLLVQLSRFRFSLLFLFIVSFLFNKFLLGFQLLQIQNQYKLIKPGFSVLDLGCAPGAWLQVACQSLGPLKNGGAVVGIDVKNRR